MLFTSLPFFMSYLPTTMGKTARLFCPLVEVIVTDLYVVMGWGCWNLLSRGKA